MKFRQLFAIPNLLCYLRIALIPYFVVTYLHAQEAIDYLYTALILAVMEITDFLDGFIARRYHMVTEIGKIIDPIADKLLQLTLLVLCLIKETSMTICGLVSIRKKCRLDGALWCGKVATTVFYICMVLLILFPSIGQPLADILLLVTAAFLIYSFIVYMKTYYQMLKKEDHD